MMNGQEKTTVAIEIEKEKMNQGGKSVMMRGEPEEEIEMIRERNVIMMSEDVNAMKRGIGMMTSVAPTATEAIKMKMIRMARMQMSRQTKIRETATMNVARRPACHHSY